MRFTSTGGTARAALLCAVVLATAYFQWTVVQAAAALLTWIVVASAMARIGLSGSSGTLSESAGRPRLVLSGMPVSHFVEKLRWTLDLVGVQYREEDDVGVVGYFMMNRTVPQLVDVASGSVIGNSDEAVRHVAGIIGPLDQPAARFFERTEDSVSWEEQLNLFGHSIQRYAYSFLLHRAASTEHALVFWGALESKYIPWVQRIVLRLFMPILKQLMRMGMKLAHPRAVAASHRRIMALLDRVDETLRRHGWEKDSDEVYLTGDGKHLSYIDITFAALCAPLLPASVLAPQSDDGGACYAAGRFPSLLAMGERIRAEGGGYPKELLDFGRTLADRPCGKFVCRLYRDLRTVRLPDRPKHGGD